MMPVIRLSLFAPLLLLSIVFSPLLTSLYATEKGVLLTEEMQLKIADAFMAEGEYYRAITEYKKFRIVFPDSDKTDYVLFKTGLAYYQGEEYESCARSLGALRQKYPESGYAAQSQYFEGLAYWKLKKYQDAKAVFQTLPGVHPNSDYAPLGLTADALLALDQENVTASRQGLERLVTTYPDYLESTKATDAMKLLDQYQNLPKKSAALAGIMSAVVPGSGYFYAGHYGDGITAFLINGLAIAGTVTAISQENYAVAAIVGGIGLPFYFGNIYGSANAAKKWNIAVRKDLRNKLYVTLNYDF
jgi:outer membrane protein assembly factor BamD (BamD/ComL family)